MVDKQEIILMYCREGRSIRDISKTLHRHRSTVSKIIREYESSIRSDNPSQALTEVLVTEPSYHGNHRQKKAVSGDGALYYSESIKETKRFLTF